MAIRAGGQDYPAAFADGSGAHRNSPADLRRVAGKSSGTAGTSRPEKPALCPGYRPRPDVVGTLAAEQFVHGGALLPVLGLRLPVGGPPRMGRAFLHPLSQTILDVCVPRLAGPV